jgi:putative toxin-antitoxin system antitoxin component (TIGR02293 family)
VRGGGSFIEANDNNHFFLDFVHPDAYFDPVGQRTIVMVPNYDAKAIAEALGLVFVQLQRKPKRAAAVNDFMVGRDDRFVIVEEAVDGSGKTARSQAESHLAPSVAFLERAVEVGFPRTALRRLVERLVGDDRSKISGLEWDVVPKTTLERRKARLSTEESERTERIARLFVHARRALGTEAEAREFMTTPHPELDGRSPFDAAMTDLGARRAESILNALEYGLAV